MSRRTKILLLLLVPVLVAGSLYLRTLVRWAFFERRPAAENAARARLSQAALQAAAGPAATVVLYFPGSDETLHAETRALALATDPEDRVRQIVLALIEGSAQGRSRALSASAEVQGVFLAADGTAYLDLSQGALNDFNPGIASESLAVYAVVNSLAANLPEVKRVQFLVQGREVDTLDGHADLTGPYAADQAWVASESAPHPTSPAGGKTGPG